MCLTPPEARTLIEQRMIALSRAHDVLTQEKWEGADLHAIVAQAPLREPGHERFHVRGPGLRLSPRMALDLAMALHELAINALKYGALSDASGAVDLAWLVDAIARRRASSCVGPKGTARRLRRPPAAALAPG